MERIDSSPVEPIRPGFRQKPWCLVILVGLVVWQCWLTLTLFGADRPWLRMIDESPILSGRHPLHLYHGYLGVRSFLERGTLSCYDPAFQAGYPKTPVFDSGSRPAELFLGLGGGEFNPAAYKIGLVCCCALVPLVLVFAGRAMGLGPLAACTACAGGLLVWWSPLGRSILETGTLDLLLAVLAAIAHVGLLLRFHQAPGIFNWIGLIISAFVGWFAMPLFFCLLLAPIFLVYYLTTGVRHGFAWHVALLCGVGAGAAANWFWLTDWIDYWWVRSPAATVQALPLQQTWQSLIQADWWGAVVERNFALILAGSSFIGLVVWNQTRRRAAARLVGLAIVVLAALAIWATNWQPLERIGLEGFMVALLLFAVFPAAATYEYVAHYLSERTGSPWRAGWIMTVAACGLVWLGWDQVEAMANRCRQAAPFQVGLGNEQQTIVSALQAHTDDGARILWEDQPDSSRQSSWTALLPYWTQRSFLGGLDPEATLEHSYAAFSRDQLAGRPLDKWGDDELKEFFARYNIGWIVCWSGPGCLRFDNWCRQGSAARAIQLHDRKRSGWLYTIKRDHSFVLRGQARWLTADRQRIALADVVPEDGIIVLSMHYQAGLHASPFRVKVEANPTKSDPIPLIRLRVTEPLSLISLSWEKP